MSDQNEVEEIAAALIEALNERDADALLALVHPDYEFHSRLVAVEGRVYRGPGGFRDYSRDIDESFADTRWRFDETVGGSGDEVMVVFRFTARGRESGAPLDVPAPQVWTFGDGRLWRNVTYASREEALEAVGLSDHNASQPKTVD